MPFKTNPLLDLFGASDERLVLDEAILANGLYSPCHDPAIRDAFFAPERWVQEKVADEYCMECPIAVSCREYALKAQERNGVWGGLTEWDRDKTKKGSGQRGRPARLVPVAPVVRRPRPVTPATVRLIPIPTAEDVAA